MPRVKRTNLVVNVSDGEVGFSRSSGEFSVSFPKVYRNFEGALKADSRFRRDHIFLLTRVLSAYRRSIEVSGTPVDRSCVKEEGNLLDFLEAATLLLDDYRQSGLFFQKEWRRESTDRAGDIDWVRTLSSSTLVSEDGFYFDPVKWSRRVDRTEFFHRLHATVVRHAAAELGLEVEIAEASLLPRSDFSRIVSSPRPRLAAARGRLFRERGIKLHRLIARYLGLASRGTVSKDDSDWFFRVTNFELVWEAMVRKLFQRERDSGNLTMIRGRWREAATGEELPGVNPRPDVLFAWQRLGTGPGETYAVILDAKDKAVLSGGVSGDAPDHYKQLLYRRVLTGWKGRVLNALVFPTLDQALLGSGWYSCRGSHSWPGIDGSLVIEIACSFRAAADLYIGKRFLEATEALQHATELASQVAPDKQESATSTVLAQAELTGATWAEEPPPVAPFVLVFDAEAHYPAAVPLLSLKAAAGGFSDAQPLEVSEWVKPNTLRKLQRGMFVAQVKGRSMEPRIPDGAWCLFQTPVEGGRDKRIVLAQHGTITDPDSGASYTVKRYRSEKERYEDGTWHHKRVILESLNADYKPIIIEGVAENEVAVVAEFLEVLE